jgi:hypothetical protein
MEFTNQTISVTPFVPLRYRKLLGPSARRFEPVTTEWITELCQSDGEFKRCFIENLENVANLGRAFSAYSIDVTGQHRSGMARLDIVIRTVAGRLLGGIEAKIDDPVHGFQLQRYRDLPDFAEGGAILIAIARAGAHEKLTVRAELAAAGVRFVSWIDLLQGLETNRSLFKHPEVEQFFSFCRLIGLDRKTSRTRAKGPNKAEVELLSLVRSSLNGWDCEPIERPDNISARLRLGRPEWKKIFGASGYKRLLIYYDGRGKTGEPNIHFQIVLFSENQHPGSRSRCSGVIGSWLTVVERHGIKHYGPVKGRRANSDDEKLRTRDLNSLLQREYWVTDDLGGQTQVNGVSVATVSEWLPTVLNAVKFYDKLVATFLPASF